jgi:hypothetical protein
MKYVHYLAALMVFAFMLSLPASASAHTSQELAAGETYSTEVAMAKGSTLFAAYESNNSLTFLIVDPNGIVVKNITGTSGGYFVEAQMDGEYRLVWQSYNVVPTSLGFDAYNDVKGIANQFVLMIIVALVAIVAVVVIAFLLIRRKK